MKKSNKQAFTLIELLIVVLIIGILAAVALPQYQLAVDKARLGKLLNMVNAVKKAQKVYFLENGTYTANWQDLTLDFSGTISGVYFTSNEGWQLQLSLSSWGNGSANGVKAKDAALPDITIWNFYGNDTVWNEHLSCYAFASNARANRLCKSATARDVRNTSSGSGNGLTYVYFFN